MDNAPNYLVGWVRYPKEIGPVAPPSPTFENKFFKKWKQFYTYF